MSLPQVPRAERANSVTKRFLGFLDPNATDEEIVAQIRAAVEEAKKATRPVEGERVHPEGEPPVSRKRDRPARVPRNT
jgi:hypothetical protein